MTELGYQYDIYISHDRLGLGHRWISEIFLNEFLPRLNEIIPWEIKVFWDRSQYQQNADHEEIRSALRGSRCLIALLSRSYFAHPVCWMEWQSFMERSAGLRVAHRSLLVPVQYHDGKHYDYLRAQNWPTVFDFRNFRHLRNPISPEFAVALEGLAQKIGLLVQNAPPLHKLNALDLPRIDDCATPAAEYVSRLARDDEEAWGYKW